MTLEKACNQKDHESQKIIGYYMTQEYQWIDTFCSRCEKDQKFLLQHFNMKLNAIHECLDFIKAESDEYQKLKEKLHNFLKLETQSLPYSNSQSLVLKFSKIEEKFQSFFDQNLTPIQKIFNQLVDEIAQNNYENLKNNLQLVQKGYLRYSEQKKFNRIKNLENNSIFIQKQMELIRNTIQGQINRGIQLFHKEQFEKALTYFQYSTQRNLQSSQAQQAYHWKGLALHCLGRYQESIQSFDLSIGLEPENAVLYNNKGSSLFYLQEYSSAIEFYDKAISLNQKFYQVYINKGCALNKLQKQIDAIECYLNAVQQANESLHPIDLNFAEISLTANRKELTLLGQNQKSLVPTPLTLYSKGLILEDKQQSQETIIHAWYHMGIILQELGMYKYSIKCFDRGLNINHKDINLLSSLGESLRLNNNLQEALEMFNKILKLDKIHLLSLTRKAQTLFGMENYMECLKICDQVLGIDRNCFAALQIKGETLLQLEHYEQSVNYLDQALQYDPNNLDLMRGIGENLRLLERYDDAFEWFNRVLSFKKPHLNTLISKSQALLQLEKYEQCIDVCNQALEIDPENFSILFNKGDALQSLKKYEESISCFDQLLNKYPDDSDLLYYKAESLRLQQEYQQALKLLDQGLQNDSQHMDSLISKSQTLLEMDQYQESIEWSNKALQIDEEDLLARFIKGESLRCLQKYEEAIRIFDKILGINNHKNSMISKAQTLLEMKKFQESIIWSNQALEIDEENVSALFIKGQALSNQKLYSEALDSFNKALCFENNSLNFKSKSLLQIEKQQDGYKISYKVLYIEPKQFILQIKKGEVLTCLQKYGEALQCFQEAIQTNPHDDNLYIKEGELLRKVKGDLQSNIEYEEQFDSSALVGFKSMDYLNKLIKGNVALKFVPSIFKVFFKKGYRFTLTKVEILIQQNLQLFRTQLQRYQTGIFNAFLEKSCSFFTGLIQKSHKTTLIDKQRKIIFFSDGLINQKPEDYVQVLLSQESVILLQKHGQTVQLCNQIVQSYPNKIQVFDKLNLNEQFYTKATQQLKLVTSNFINYYERIKCCDQDFKKNTVESLIIVDKRNFALKKQQANSETKICQDWEGNGPIGFAFQSQQGDSFPEYKETIQQHNQPRFLKKNNYYHKKGHTLASFKKYNKAKTQYDKAIGLNLNIENAYFQKGCVLASLKKYKKVIKYFNKAISLDSQGDNQNIQKDWALQNLEKQESFIFKKKHNKAITCQDKAIGLNLNIENAYFQKGCALALLKKYMKAAQCFNKVISFNSYDILYIKKGCALEQLKRYGAAVRCYDAAIKFNYKNDIAYYKKGCALKLLNQNEEALQCFDAAIRLNLKNDNAYFKKGCVLQQLVRIQDAIDCYSIAIHLIPIKDKTYFKKNRYPLYQGVNQANSLNFMNLTQFQHKKYTLSEYKEKFYSTQLEAAIENFYESNKLDNQAIDFLIKGKTLMAQRKYMEAINFFDKASQLDMKLHPNTFYYPPSNQRLQFEGKNNQILNWIRLKHRKNSFFKDRNRVAVYVLCQMKLKKEINAFIILELGLRYFPKDSELFFCKAEVLRHQQRFEESITNYDLALKQNPNHFKSRYKKWKLLMRLHNFDKAKALSNETYKDFQQVAEANFMQGEMLRHENKTLEAIKQFNNALKIDPQYQQSLKSKGNALAQQNCFKEVLQCFRIFNKEKNLQNNYDTMEMNYLI